MQKWIIVFFLWVYSSSGFGQENKTLNIDVQILLNDSPLAIKNEEMPLDSSRVSISVCKFYLSTFKLLNKETVVLEEKNSFHLIDAQDIRTQTFEIPLAKDLAYDAIEFLLGIDSNTNAQGISSGPLDPLNGMYWTWQSGYINFKLEGKSLHCSTPKNEFQFHVGGYLPGQNASQIIRFPIEAGKDFQIVIDIDKILKKIDLSTKHHLMSPSKDAILLSTLISQAISIKEK